MDISMPGLDGLQATRAIACEQTLAGTRILTTFDLDEYVFGAIRSGAGGFLVKDTELADLLAAVPQSPTETRFSLRGSPDD